MPKNIHVKMLLIVSIFFVFNLVFVTSASAHRPYANKIATLQSPSGKTLIIEKLYGDGIFVADPGNLQVRNSNGTVVAASPTGDHIFSFCPSLEFCWALPYSSTAIIQRPWKLDYKSIDYDQKSKTDDRAVIHAKSQKEKEDVEKAINEERDALKAYVSDVNSNEIRGYELGYPEPSDKTIGFIQGSAVTALFSPIMIVLDHFLGLTFLAFFILLPFIPYPSYIKFIASGKRGKGWVQALALLFSLAYFAVGLFILFIMSFTLSFPIFYSITFICLGVVFGKRYVRKRVASQNPP